MGGSSVAGVRTLHTADVPRRIDYSRRPGAVERGAWRRHPLVEPFELRLNLLALLPCCGVGTSTVRLEEPRAVPERLDVVLVVREERHHPVVVFIVNGSYL